MRAGAQLRTSRNGQPVGYENRRGKVVAGGFLIVAGCCYALLATAVSSLWTAVVLPLGVIFVVLGARTAYAGVLQVAPPNLELRYTLHTERIPLANIERCRPRTDTHDGRLRSEKTYPELVLRSGRLVCFPLVQWLPDNPEDAEAACEQITAMIRAGAPR